MAKAGIVYVGTSDGLLIWSDPASIGRWRRVGHELAGSAVRSFVAHSALHLVAAVTGVGVRRSDDGGQSWQPAGDVDSALLAAHDAAPMRLFAATGDDIVRSDDNGATWSLCPRGDRPAERITALIVDIHNAERLLVGLQESGVWTSVDGGQRWDVLGAGVAGKIERIVVSPNRPGRVFAVAGGALWQAGEGALWTTVAGSVALAASGALALLSGADEALLVATVDGIARSIDDGDTWQSAAFDEPLAAPVSVIAAATYHIDTAWAGTADGRLLVSTDRGRSWRTIAHSLPPIHDLAAVRLA